MRELFWKAADNVRSETQILVKKIQHQLKPKTLNQFREPALQVKQKTKLLIKTKGSFSNETITLT